MNLYRGNVLGTDWRVSIEADKYKVQDGCTIFYTDNKGYNEPVALYPTDKLIINEIIHDYDSEIDN